MNVMVIGGAGYIGSVVVEQLVAQGHGVVVLDDLSRGHRGAVCDGAELVIGDYGDADAVGRVLAGAASKGCPIDAAFHFGARSLVGESVVEPLMYWQANVSKGIALVEALLRGGVRRLVFSSTAAIFGEPDVVPISESHPTRPTNPYGHTKLTFERVLADADAAHGFHSICLRYFNAAGATTNFGEDHEPETHLIPLALKAAAEASEGVSENPLQVFGNDYPTRDGTCVRDYIHVSDLASAHLLALDALMADKPSAQFNLGNGTGYTVMEVLQAVSAITGRAVPHVIATRRPGDPAVLVAASDKARAELGWRPARPELSDIVADAWTWMQAHPKGYNKSR